MNVQIYIPAKVTALEWPENSPELKSMEYLGNSEEKGRR